MVKQIHISSPAEGSATFKIPDWLYEQNEDATRDLKYFLMWLNPMNVHVQNEYLEQQLGILVYSTTGILFSIVSHRDTK